MPHHRRLLIVVADGEHARFVRPGPDNALHTETAFDSPTVPLPSSALRSDHPGASFHSDSSAHHAETPRHDPHTMEKQRFGQFVGSRLDAPEMRDTFDDLVIAAPPHCLSALRAGLDAATDAKIVGTLGKDLTKTPDHQLAEHLRAWVAPTHRARA